MTYILKVADWIVGTLIANCDIYDFKIAKALIRNPQHLMRAS